MSGGDAMRPRALVFDLAGVLLDFGGVESLRDLSNARLGAEEFGRFMSRSPWANALYSGRCSPEAFAAGAVDEFSPRRAAHSRGAAAGRGVRPLLLLERDRPPQARPGLLSPRRGRPRRQRGGNRVLRRQPRVRRMVSVGLARSW